MSEICFLCLVIHRVSFSCNAARCCARAPGGESAEE